MSNDANGAQCGSSDLETSLIFRWKPARGVLALQLTIHLSSVFLYFPSTDIWTTRCTRCPAALDKLNEMASSDNDDANSDNRIQFVSICCDKLDGAREILDRDSTPRWNNMRHFFMDHEHKERAKQLLGFKQVPFYIVFDDTGAMLFSGSKLPNLVDLLNRKKKEESTLLSTPLPTSKTTSASSSPSDVFAIDFDELDF